MSGLQKFYEKWFATTRLGIMVPVVGSFVLLVLIVAIGRVTVPGHREPEGLKPGQLYRVLSGKIVEQDIPILWKKRSLTRVVHCPGGQSELLLADGSHLQLQGKCGLGERKRYCCLIEGKGRFRVVKADTPFIVVSRPATVKVVGTDFVLETRELPARQPKELRRPGDNPADLQLQVSSGEVQVQIPGRKRVKQFQAGQTLRLVLGEVRRRGEIQGLGFGLSKKKGKIGKLLQKRAARARALTSVAEFIAGIKFVATGKTDRLSFSKIEFNSQAHLQMSNMRFVFQDLTPEVMLCTAKALSDRNRPVARRNCKKWQCRGGTFVHMHKNLPMAIISARNNAVLLVVQQAAAAVYGRLPQKVSGTFYPESFLVQQEGKKIIAEVSGEVLFD